MQMPFYYDYACPWAFFGSLRVERYFADLGVEVDFRPVLLRDLAEKSPNAGKLPPMGERKQKNYMNDFLRFAEFSGVEISKDAREVMKTDTRLALQVALAAQETGSFAAYHPRAYEARWVEARDLSKREVLGEILDEIGADSSAILARAEDAEVSKRLDEQTRHAIDRGVFGVPTVFVGDEMFWGNDRFELARYFIAKG